MRMLLFALLCASPALGIIRRVPEEYANVQAAIDAAASGDEVVISPGSYAESVDLLGKEITLRGSAPEDDEVVMATVLSAAGAAHVLSLTRGEGPTLEGLTITGATEGGIYCANEAAPLIRRCLIRHNRAYRGAGLSCGTGAAPQIEDCVIAYNQADFQGGGLFFEQASVQLARTLLTHNRSGSGAALWCNEATLDATDLRVEHNDAEKRGGAFRCVATALTIARSHFALNRAGLNGGALRFSSSNALVIACTLDGNWAGEDGGGIYSYHAPRFLNCLLVNNSAGNRGGAVFASYGAELLFRNCTLVDNDAPEGAAVFSRREAQTTLIGSVLWDHGDTPFGGEPIAISYSDVQGGHEGDGNIDALPQFLDWQEFSHLPGPLSPCIDAGTGAEDSIDWENINPHYPNSAIPDMGAYGGAFGEQWLLLQLP